MFDAHRSLALFAFVVAGAAGGVAGAAITEASVTSPGAITVAHERVAGTELTLLVAPKLYGPPRYRDADFTLGDDPPEVEDDEGNVMSEGGASSTFHRVAEGGRPPLAVDTDETDTCRLAVMGTAAPVVAKVAVRRADGTLTPVRLRAAPSGWHYRGRFFGAFVRTNASPARSIRAFSRSGRLLRTVELPRVSAACVQPPTAG